ncbi:serine/threonine protein kinase [Solirubrobacter pauli]|uniref:non-specific serine/threonine protein kinase n=1 Tax=Solirubrobacter pauli TaxID=166793 RepID=A0A660L6J4_9ACTN|nr:serine/threonine-protein kinase [Solirubrobacter pauli]RKQ90637.1 serine/threonine protein kinase [Solirubrobacter pauli]
MAELSVGATFAGHEILGVAGRGGMGVVYRARDLRLKREVALKVIAPEQSAEPEFRTRFRRECEVAASLHHPNLIPVYTAGEEDGHLYVTMRYVDGVDLAHLIDRRGRLTPERAVAIIVQVARALDAAHAFGVVHRDVKPGNVLLDGDHALLTDFGLQRDLNATTRVTEPGTLIGSFDYTAPEQLEDGDVDARTDVYALGCVLYEALTGEVPFPRDSPAAKMYAHLGAPVPDLDGPLAAVVRRALAKRPEQRFASTGALGAAALSALGGVPAVAAPAPRPAPLPPALLAETGAQPFVGRAHHRERIEHHLAAALDGERRFLLLEGEPGIGKTRLASESARDAHGRGTTVLYGRCDPDALIPYQPFAMALPDVHERERFAFFDAVTRRLAQRPTLLILDDLHWADPATLQLLAHVLADPEPMRLLVLATSRARSERLPSPSERLALTGLEQHELSALVVALGEPAPSLESLRSLHERTAGNPLFVAETLHADGLPDTIRDVIERRLADLAEPTRHVLAVAAVMGRSFRLDVLETLADGALDAVEEACAKGLVREAEQVDHFLFAHALVRETLYERMSNARRVRLHRSIGEALERSGTAAPAELARHFHAARHLEPAKAFDYAVQAARRAEFEEAVAHYRHAIEIDPRLDLLLALGRAELTTGEPTARATFARAAARAREAGDASALAQAALGFNARQAASGVLDQDGIALLEEADAALQDGPLRARIKARLADALHFAHQTDRTIALSADALALAGEDPEARAAALVARHTALLHVEHLEERLDLAREIIAVGHPELTALGRWWCVYDLLEAGEPAAARSQHEALTRLAEQLRQPLYRHFAAAWDVVWAQVDDRVADVEPLAERAFALGVRAAAPDAAMIQATQVMAVRIQQGRLREYLEAVAPLAREFPHLAGWRGALALGLLIAGRRDEGEAAYAALADAELPRDMQWLSTMSFLTWCCTLLGDRERAGGFYAALLPYRDRSVQDVLAANWGSVERFLGALATVSGDHERALDHFELALDRNAGNAQALRLTRMDYGAALLASGDAERARPLLERALADAQAAGLTAVADALALQLSDASLRSPADHPPRPAAR